MKKTNILTLIFVLAMAVCLAGCAKNVPIGGEKQPEDTKEIITVLESGELSSLDSFPALEKVDLSGSKCYDEIVAWSKSHPQVEVLYTVEFPDGSVIPSDVKELSLGGAQSADAEAILSLLSYLPALEKLSFTGSDFPVEDVEKVEQSFENIEVEYSFPLFGNETDYRVKSLDLSGVSAPEIAEALPVLASLPCLEKLELGREEDGKLGWDAVNAIADACPQAELAFAFTLYGKSFDLRDKVIDINHIPVGDNGEAVVRAMRFMKNLETLDMDFCGVDNETMQSIRDAFPEVNVIWRVWFGEAYSVRTDTEKILASKPSVGGNLTPANTTALRYCTKVKYLDVGHNEILGDIGFVQYMPELEVAILAMDNISDLSPLAACTKLEYLEIQTNPYTDLTPLAGLTNLEHLNIVKNGGVTDLSPLFNLTKLQRLWIGYGKYPFEQAEELMKLLPECEIDTAVGDPTGGRWRVIGTDPDPNKFWVVYYHPRYEKLMEQFGYTDKDYSFSWNDPKYG